MEHCTIGHEDTGVFLANERKTKLVTAISIVTMIVEISVGYWSQSMALLADGWHMASHSMAFILSLFVYYLYRHPRFRASFTFGGGKILSLGGYTSSLLLIFIAGSMIYESFFSFFETKSIHYEEALIVAGFGLIINLVCAKILHTGDDHHHHDHHDHDHKHDHHHHDHNHQSAYVHVLTDALTSVLAIFALIMGKWQGWSWLDPAVGMIGGIVVMKWAINLIRQSGMDLLDAHEDSIDRDRLVKVLEEDGSKVMDIHLWKLAPGQVGCEIVIKNNQNQGSADYRDLIQTQFEIHHLIIEVI